MNTATHSTPAGGTFAAAVAPTDPTAGLREGERRKGAALDLLRARREVFVRRGQRAMLAVLLDGSPTATADDVRAAVELPPDLDARLLGAVPRSLAFAGIVRRCDFQKSCRPERHASFVGVWELADRQAALDWLARNPDSPDVEAEPLDDLPLWQAVNEKRPTAGTAGRSMQSPSTTKGIHCGKTL